MENAKLEKLKKVLELLKEDTISPAKLTQIVSALVDTVRKSTENNEKLSTEIKGTFEQVVDYIDKGHDEAIKALKNENEKRVSKTEKQANEALRAAQEARREIESLVIPEEVDKEEIIEEALKRVPKVEIPEVVEETGDSIVSKINDLPEDGEKIDASHIKNLPEATRQVFGGVGLIKEIVAGTNITVDNSKLGYPVISATGGSGTGDMDKATYDPNDVGGDAFDMDNMAESETAKIMTADERTKLSGIAEGAEVNVQPDWNQTTNTADDYIKNKPTIPAAYTLPTAAADTLGGIKVGARLTITDGVLAADEQGGSYTLPTATASVKGGVKIGTGISVTEDGTISATAGGTGDVVGPVSAVDSNFAAFDTTTGKLIKDSGKKAADFAASDHAHTGTYEPADATLQSSKHTHSNKATLDNITAAYTSTEASKLAGIAEGAEVNVQPDWNQTTNTADDYIKNKPTIPAAYTLPIAAADTLGGVKVGTNLSIADGVLSADKQLATVYEVTNLAELIAVLEDTSNYTKVVINAFQADIDSNTSIKVYGRTTFMGNVYLNYSGDYNITITSESSDSPSLVFRDGLGFYGITSLRNTTISVTNECYFTIGTTTLTANRVAITASIVESYFDNFTYEKLTAFGGGSLTGGTQSYWNNTYTHPSTHSADIITDGTTQKAYTATEKTKLGTIAEGAEVNVNADWNAASGDAQILNKPTIPTVDATSVASAGAVMEGDTTTASMSFVVDEDNMASNSATKVPTQQSVKAYADSLVAGLLDYRGGYDASGNAFPTTGGSGTAGAVLKGDMFIISGAGTLGSVAVQVGDSLIANVDTPAQTAGNWNILNSNISYVPEDAANKKTSLADNSDTYYPTQKAVKTAVDAKLATADKAAASDLNTGTDNTKYVTADAIAGSNLGIRYISQVALGADTSLTVADGVGIDMIILPAYNGMNLVYAQAVVETAGTTNATTIQIHNVTDNTDMLSTNISIASGDRVGTAGTVDTSHDDVATNDLIRIDVDAISTTAPKGLTVVLGFQLP